jgi:hypothetical protein
VLVTIIFSAGMLWAQSSRSYKRFCQSHAPGEHVHGLFLHTLVRSDPQLAERGCDQVHVKCMKAASPAVIVTGGKVFHLKCDTATAAEYVGQYVNGQGTVTGDTMLVVSVSAEIRGAPARSIANRR